MSKFEKRLKKLGKKDLNNSIIVGNDLEQLEEITDVFKSVFLIADIVPSIRKKNLICINDQDFASSLTSIDFIFLNHSFDLLKMKFLSVLLRKTYPVILVNEKYPISIEYKDFLYGLRYEMLDIQMGYQVWKVIRR